MAPAKFSAGLCAALLFASALPALAQLSPTEPDPLARIRDAAKSNVQACSATGESLCEQVAPKIIANALGESSLAENLRQVNRILKGHKTRASEEAAEIDWAVAAFRDAGVEAHVEKYTGPNRGSAAQENVVAEFRGRENPEDWALVGAHLGPRASGPGWVDSSCDAAAVVELARDISHTGVHPRISLRFVLFTGDEQKVPASWAYVRSHRAELDHARAAIIFHSNCLRVTGYSTNGRPDLESGLREAMKPIESFEANQLVLGATTGTDDFEFLLEGVPTLSAYHLHPVLIDPAPRGRIAAMMELADVRHNIAVVAVTAFGIAERAEPIGPRQSRAEIESLLKATGLENQMKTTDLWPLWESGQRGRSP